MVKHWKNTSSVVPKVGRLHIAIWYFNTPVFFRSSTRDRLTTMAHQFSFPTIRHVPHLRESGVNGLPSAGGPTRLDDRE
jgi:hypothetical protein